MTTAANDRRTLKAFRPLLHSSGFTPERQRKQIHLLPLATSYKMHRKQRREDDGDVVVVGGGSRSLVQQNKAIQLNIPSPADLVSRKNAILE